MTATGSEANHKIPVVRRTATNTEGSSRIKGMNLNNIQGKRNEREHKQCGGSYH